MSIQRARQTEEIKYIYCPQCKHKLSFSNIENKSILSCTQCGFIFWNNPVPVVSALIIKNNKVLLIKRKGEVYKGYWALPGGIINQLEKPDDALLREVHEETGFTIKSCKLVDAYLIIYAPKGIKRLPSHTSIDLVYQSSLLTSDLNFARIQNNSEVEEIKWFHLSSLPSRIAFGHRDMIIKHSSLSNSL